MNIQDFYQKLDQLFAQHDMAAIEKYMTDSLASARLDNDPAAIVAVGNELAGFYRVSGKVDDAIRLSQNVLQVLKNMGQETTENFAVALQNAANVLVVAGDRDTALQMYRTAEQILAYRGFSTDYRMAALYNNISALQREMEDFEEAEKSALKSLEIIAGMPQYRAEMATSLVNLGEVQTRRQKFDEAKETLEAAMTIYELESGDRDPHYATANAALGNLYYYWKKPAEAVPYFRRAMELIERDHGRNAFYEMMARNLKTVEEQI
ncbi:MAG: tetratricopeptide repeat protein [Firmicutes bacterium]|nr:tetratricopeptide repeat protein [Bacillota bacterium]